MKKRYESPVVELSMPIPMLLGANGVSNGSGQTEQGSSMFPSGGGAPARKLYI